jgi:NAD(P)-dependent dehydrogenase (short-subunit alcohol dehydrogenase family)
VAPASDTTTPDTRVILVTGSARGLGLATARAFRALGDRVHVTWRTSNSHALALQREFGDRAHRADLERDAETLIDAVTERDGRLDVLIHAVGDYQSGPLESFNAAALETLFTSNVSTAVRTLAAARPHLRHSHGNALFFGVAGIESLRGRRESAAYAAVKTALLVLVRSWALEEAPHQVRVNSISPGIIPHEGAAADTLDPARQSRIPAGRPGTPEEVAAAAVFLCSDAARYTTGADLSVAGGWML